MLAFLVFRYMIQSTGIKYPISKSNLYGVEQLLWDDCAVPPGFSQDNGVFHGVTDGMDARCARRRPPLVLIWLQTLTIDRNRFVWNGLPMARSRLENCICARCFLQDVEQTRRCPEVFWSRPQVGGSPTSQWHSACLESLCDPSTFQ